MARSSDLIVSLAARAGPVDLGTLTELPGVQHVHLDDHRTWLLVSFDSQIVSAESIVAELTAIGFAVASVSFDE